MAKANNGMKKLVDEYVTLREKIDSLKVKEEDMRERVLNMMKEKKRKVLMGTKDNHITKTESDRLTIDAKAFRKEVTDKEFMECVKVGVTKARQYVAPAELEKISVITEVISLNIK
jgi:microcystin degradation protein MlrC